MLFCNEVLVETVDGFPVRYVCEAEYGTEHTHAEKMDYMRREGGTSMKDEREITLMLADDGGIIAETDNGNAWGKGRTVEEAVAYCRGAMLNLTDTALLPGQFQQCLHAETLESSNHAKGEEDNAR